MQGSKITVTDRFNVDYADRQHSEMHSELTRQIEYPLQVLYLSGEL